MEGLNIAVPGARLGPGMEPVPVSQTGKPQGHGAFGRVAEGSVLRR